jgi:N4-bis(aminopropyl)spermidine synthase
VLPGFNRYVGAQAIGSASNLYLLRPTAGTRRVLGRLPATRRVNVYTHGAQALEGGPGPLPPPSRAALVAAAGEGSALDLRHDTGPLLLRALLAGDGDRLAVLVPNRHPDIAGAAGQVALRALVGARWDLRYRRSDPGPHLAIVEATTARVPADDVGAHARRHVLDRPGGRLANVGREALIAATAGRRAPLTKNAARAVLADVLAGADLDASLLDLPRGAMAAVLDGLATAAEGLVADR